MSKSIEKTDSPSFEYNWKLLLESKTDIDNIINYTIKRSTKNLNNITRLSNEEKDKFIKQLFDDTYEFNRMYALAGIAPYLTNNVEIKKTWLNAEKELEGFINKVNSNTLIPKKIIENYKSNINHSENLILEKILDNYKKKGIVIEENDYIIKLKHTINKFIEKNQSIILKGYISKITKFNISYFNYPLLVREVFENTRRHNLLDEFYKNNNFIEDLAKVALYKNEIAKNAKFNNFYEYINENNIELFEIKNTIVDMIKDLAPQIHDDIQLIKKETKLEKVNTSDINSLCFYIRKDIKFVVNDVIKNIIHILESTFKINIIPSTKLDGWDDDILVLEVKKNNKIIGIINLDIMKNNKKPMGDNICKFFKLTGLTNYPYNKNKLEASYVCILGNYTSLTTQILNFDNVFTLITEFTKAIFSCFELNTYNFNFLGDEFDEFIRLFIKELIFDENNFNLLCHKDKNIIHKIKLSYDIQNRVELFVNCVETIFDLLLYGNPEVVRNIKTSIKNNNNLSNVMNDFFNKLTKSFYTHDDFIIKLSPYFVMNIMDKESGKYYYRVINKIITFYIYKYIKNNNQDEFINLIENKLSIYEIFRKITENNNLENKINNIINKITFKKKNNIDSENAFIG
jgi:hypothetical protein